MPAPLIFGLTANQTMPAFGSPSMTTPVAAAPHSVPLAYHVCCMRVSFASGCDSTSGCHEGGNTAGTAKKRAQHPMPPPNRVLSFRHSPSGISPVFWFALGGSTYVGLLIVRLVHSSAGVAVSSDAVLVIAQRPMRFAV